MSRQHPKVPLQQTILPRRWLKSASRFRPLLETLEDRTVPADFFNTNPIVIPSSGAASPYPSAITVTGMSGNITDVNVTLNNFSHTWTNDVDILLVSPTGQKLMLMSDVGGSASLSGLTITLDDAAASNLPGSAFGSGTYRPTNIADGSGDDIFPAPAPAAPYGSTLSIFNGFAANGTWSLFVRDDVGGLSGSIAGGWKLSVFTGAPPSDVPDTIGTALNTGMGPGAGTYTNTTVIGDGTFTTRDVDMYAFQATAGQTLVASTAFPGSGTSMDTYLRLFNAAGTQLAFNDDFTGLYSQITFTIPTTATYYIGVSGFSNSAYNPNSGGSGIAGSTGDYRLTLTTTGTSSDVPDTIGTALNTGMGPGAGSYINNSQLGDGSFGVLDVDMYAFQATAGQQLTAQTLSTGGSDADTILRLFNAGGTQLAVDDDGNGFPYSRITFTIPTTGTYYIGVSGYSNFGYNPNSGGSGTTGSTGAYRLSLATVVVNVPPSNVIVTPPGGGFLEGTSGTINVSFTDPDVADAHTIDIDWDNNGTFDETFGLAAGFTSFTRNHIYTDDGISPGNGSAFDPVTIVVRVADAGGNATGSGNSTINNVIPNTVTITNGAFSINENGSFTLNGSFIDAGTLDVHTVDIDWNGDGSFDQSVVLATGARTFSFTSPVYADDNPSGTPFDTNNVNVRVRDDDTGVSTTATSTVTVNNVAPSAVTLDGPYSINENGSFTLNGSFIDPGTLDVHTVEVDWNGDGSYDQSVTLTTGDRTFSITSPIYVDDNPTGTAFDTNAINVRVSDDDTSVGLGGSTLTVNNVAPTITAITPTAGVDGSGNAVACNPVTFQIDLSDPSLAASETFRYEVDWDGNGTVDEIFPTAGFTASRSISLTHEFDVTTTFRVRGVDDDTGVGAWTSYTIPVITIAIVDGNLVVAGSNVADSITINTYTAGSATVTRNGVNSTWALPTGARIVVRGCAGNDVIAVNGAVSAELYGGAGNDVMYGGSGQDMLWGEDGNDTLSLGAGNDVAIGGLGRDLLYGGNGNDILLGGAIDPLNYTWASLQSASAAWNSYVGVPPSVPPEVLALMAATTDPNDVNNYDRFWGNAGKDAFVYRTSGTLDQINDYKASEFDGLAGF